MESIRKVLYIDGDDSFRGTVAAALQQSGIETLEASRGSLAVELARREKPSLVILDLNVPDPVGLEVLIQIRKEPPHLPFIIVTGEGSLSAVFAALKHRITDYIRKPVPPDKLARHIQALIETGVADSPLRERTVAELMISPTTYPRLYIDEPVVSALEALKKAFYYPVGEGTATGQVRSALVYDREERFYGIIRFNDLLGHMLPTFDDNFALEEYEPGQFLAQCRVFGHRQVRDLVGKRIFISPETPLMEAVYMMHKYNLINLPVLHETDLVGILRGRDLVLELSRNLGMI